MNRTDTLVAFEDFTTKMPGRDAHPPQPPDAACIVERLIAKAEKANVSDIHLQATDGTAEISFRVDGVLTPIETLPEEIAQRVFGRIKFLANLKTYQDSLPQDGRIERTAVNSSTDLRVATYPTVTGEKIVLRLFQPTKASTMEMLGFSESALRDIKQFLRHTSGLLLLTGPSGSGKTTTIYACLRELAAAGGRHIITVEDPAEQIVPGVMQTEVNESRGLNFAKAARHLLRHDPQVLVIGEMRDEETAEIAVRAALTGHLVISTLHAGSCGGVCQRLLSLCPDRSAVAAALEMVINQRLVRALCSACRGEGCDACLASGYRGRVPITETVRITAPLRRAIISGTLEDIAAEPNLAAAAGIAIKTGVTDGKEIRRVLGL